MITDKKQVLNLIFLIAIASTIASLLIPTHSYNNIGLDNDSEHYWKSEFSIVFYHVSIFNTKDGADFRNSIYERYTILNFIEFNIGTKPFELGTKYFRDYSEYNKLPFSRALFDFVGIAFRFVTIALVSYFCYKSFKEFGHEKNMYLLVLGIGLTLVLIMSLTIGFYLISSINAQSPGFSNPVSIEYGSFVMIFSSILLLILHFKQDYLLNNADKENLEKIK